MRIKEQSKTPAFTGLAGKYWMLTRNQCLRICTSPAETQGVPEVPDLFITHESPPMERPSYVHATKDSQWILLDQLQTFCVPPVRIQQESLIILSRYIETLSYTTVARYGPGNTPMPRNTYHSEGHSHPVLSQSATPSSWFYDGSQIGVAPSPYLYNGYTPAQFSPMMPINPYMVIAPQLGSQYTLGEHENGERRSQEEHAAYRGGQNGQ